MIGYILDTNVLSEPGKSAPDVNVVEWLRMMPEHELFVSVVTLGEICRGVARLSESRKRVRYVRFLTQLVDRFLARTLTVDAAIAMRWGTLLAGCERRGTPMPAIDSLLAATTLTHGLTMATRNVDDFSPSGVSVYNPWLAPT